MSIAQIAKYALLLGAVVWALFAPKAGDEGLRRIEKMFEPLARRKLLVCLGFAALVLGIRAALLPVWPIPKPVIYDEFSYILQADTFAHGRMTNPTHKLWAFFESPYVIQKPTYASKYPPAQSLAMSVGQVLFGHPWFGVWLSCGLMIAAICWVMQAWLPPGWALFGTALAIPLAITSYWMNSYWGGAVAATGGALLLGGYARVFRQRQTIHALTMGVGLVILANTRPYEGLIFSIPVAILFLMQRPGIKILALVLATLIPGFALTGYYNYRVTGKATQLPFIEYAEQYVYIPLFNIQPLQTPKFCKNPVMYDLHQTWEKAQWEKARSIQLLSIRFKDWHENIVIILGSVFPALLLACFSLNLLRDKRIRLPLLCLLAAAAGSMIEVCYYTHYAGPVTCALFILVAQALRHLRQWKYGGDASGRTLARVLPLVIIFTALMPQAGLILEGKPPESRQPVNARRDAIAEALTEKGAKHVVLVRYSGTQSPHEEWVYNLADIDAQDVIWAHDLGVENGPLVEYYKDRKIWLFDPDKSVEHLDPYVPGATRP